MLPGVRRALPSFTPCAVQSTILLAHPPSARKQSWTICLMSNRAPTAPSNNSEARGLAQQP
eukprot:7090468-Alexandrium_andersonii.AAC.1